MKKLLIAVFALTLSIAHAQVADFSLTDVTSDKTISLSSFSSSPGLVVVFTSNVCPFDEYYKVRINKLAKDFNKVPLVLVNSGVEAAESIDAMKLKAQQSGLSVPYLADKDQLLMQSLKATKTPQAFLLKNTEGKFQVVYSGAIDDNAQVESDVRTSYLRKAVESLLANQPIASAEVRAAGCNIKRK